MSESVSLLFEGLRGGRVERGVRFLSSYQMACVVCHVACPKRNASLPQLNSTAVIGRRRAAKSCSRLNFATASQVFDASPLRTSYTTQERVKEILQKQAALVREQRISGGLISWDLNEAYDRCLDLAAKDASTVLLTASSHSLLNAGLAFMIKTVSGIWKPERLKALAAIEVWCRRTDDLVDGINGCLTTPEVLDRWEQRLTDLFQSGRACDIYDAALLDTIRKYPIDIQLFKDLIEGMRMDLRKTRYENFDELSLYFYHVAGSVALMMVQLFMGTNAPAASESLETIYNAALAFAFALQLTDIFRDIQEDARMGRIYLPQDELADAGLSEEDIFSGKVTDKWRSFMKGQIRRARMYFDEGDKLIFVDEFDPDDKSIFSALTLAHRQLLDNIEASDYSFTDQASLGITKQAASAIAAQGISLGGSSSECVDLAKTFVRLFP